MTQHGSYTTINDDNALIIMDCFETVVAMHQRTYVKRNGIARFLQHFRGKRQAIVIHSDAKRHLIEHALAEAGLADAFDAIYDADNASKIREDHSVIKRLSLPMLHFETCPLKTVFIGDSPMDATAAAHYEVPFIRVPRSEDRHFSFDQLIDGPSRYSSEIFLGNLKEFYRN